MAAGLFDGMGGLAEGEKISGAAAKSFSAFAEEHIELLNSGNWAGLQKELSRWVNDLNTTVREYGKRKNISAGTTVVCLFTDGVHFLEMNVGDSRGYLLRSGTARKLSCDHSAVGRLVEAGLLSWEDAAKHPDKNLLTQSVGMMEALAPDFYEEDCRDGDAFLLCCDGFYYSLLENEIASLGDAGIGKENLTQALKTMADTAIARGETDNITGILIKIKK